MQRAGSGKFQESITHSTTPKSDQTEENTHRLETMHSDTQQKAQKVAGGGDITHQRRKNNISDHCQQ